MLTLKYKLDMVKKKYALQLMKTPIISSTKPTFKQIDQDVKYQ